MGLAASQARFLGITARKSNIEYEGQQVNQQRTALAEEVNALYNKLLELKKPIPPEETEFYESNYAFNLTNTQGLDGSYIVKSYYQNNDGSYYLNTKRTYTKDIAVGTKLENSKIVYDENYDWGPDADKGATVISTPQGEFLINFLTEDQSSSKIALINETYGEGTVTDNMLVYYVDNAGQTHYFPISQSAIGNTDINSYIMTQSEVSEDKVFEKAEVTLDANGRFSSLYAIDPATGDELFGATDVNTKRTNNTEAYDAALRDYTMSQDEYDKKFADLNAQTKSLQQEDKILELRLNQIDTEQKELQTELDAVKAVLQKNVENTFNTFS